MENATKALLIAGALLIVIIIMTIGLRMFDSTGNVTNQVSSTSSDLEVSMFNSQFLSYMGKNVPGDKVKTLVSKIITNNSQNPSHVVLASIQNNGTDSQILAHQKGKPNLEKLQEIYDSVDTSATYLVRVAHDCSLYKSTGGYDKDGYLACIYIERNS